MKNLRTSAVCAIALAASALAFSSAYALAQETSAVPPASNTDATAMALRDLQEQVRLLRTMVDEMHSENVQSRAEMQQLRQELQATRTLLERNPASVDLTSAAAATPLSAAPAPSPTSASDPQPAAEPSTLEDRVQKLEESTSLLGSKVDEHYQTKVETASKYRARLSGIVLMNAFRNLGASNNLDLPDYAVPLANAGTSSATLGATLRQSEIGLEIFGPTLYGAKSSANVQMDFGGGFANTGNGFNFGIVRLQTADLRLDWEHTSVVAGQDSLFFSPLSPTSFASLATPTFAFAGNLWGWIPQLRVEHRFNFSSDQTLTVQAGILNNVDWEFPNSFQRSAQAGEQSGQPAYAMRTSWSRPVFAHPLSFGVAGYYGRQNWTWGRYVDAWAGMADWQIPILPRLGLSGEFYRGRGIGGLGAGMGESVLFGGLVAAPATNTTPIRGLDSIGGWTQLKFQLTPKLELNGTIAENNSYASDVRGFAIDANQPSATIIGRNRGILGNFVYRPRSDLLFSAELRRLRSFPIYSSSSFTNQLNLAMGILF
jgi:hypothetical protein